MSYGACDDAASDAITDAYDKAMASAGRGVPIDKSNECPPVAASDACFGVGSPPASILTEAASLISGERRDAYGPVHDSFKHQAAVWTAVLQRKLKEPLTGPDVALCMVGFKLCREANKAGRDNRVDIAGYAALLDQLYEK